MQSVPLPNFPLQERSQAVPKGSPAILIIRVFHTMSLPPPQHLQSDSSAADESDTFLSFVEHARSVLSSPDDRGLDSRGEPTVDESGSSWSWIASWILKTCIAYSSGVTSAILLSDLFQSTLEPRRN
ncbi:Uncharacterized protein M6B38_244790 [Iris pallida]|uniref:Cell division control protein 24 OB domain-containing protein n=1 Tax=Iris pallida TaxID=29817 RepID=A0AAX6DI63_IRIPA|nr:Uncharacterized protein M6B38_244790 [Iris pallida]